MSLDIEWERPLQHRRGGPTRLDGLDVYFDFDWLSVFPDRRMHFRNGQVLAKRVRGATPEGKRPVMLLTTIEDVEERAIETDTDYIFVVNLPRYLEEASGDAAVSYLARNLGIGRLSEFADVRPAEVRAFLDLHLDADRIAEWASSDDARIEAIRRIPGVQDEATAHGPIDVLNALQTLEELDSAMVVAIAELLGPEVDSEDRLRLLRALTDDSEGRYVTGEVLSQRTTDRLADARDAVADYSALLADTDASETDVQRFLEQNLWLLGLDYAAMRHRRPLPRGEMDFILERFDGFHDVLELKSPQDPIITGPAAADMPPSASAYSLSPTLAGALAQVHVYRDILTSEEGTIERLYGLQNTRDPRVIIVVGSSERLPDHFRRVLRELNRSLHRVEIVPYDVLGERATAVLDNVNKYLLVANSESGAPPIDQ